MSVPGINDRRTTISGGYCYEIEVLEPEDNGYTYDYYYAYTYTTTEDADNGSIVIYLSEYGYFLGVKNNRNWDIPEA